MILNIIHIVSFAVQVCAFENLALGKPVWEQHPWPGSEDYGSQNAVDGLYSSRIASGGQCTISAGGKLTATLRVDLRSMASISHINIYYRTDGDYYVSRMAGYFLYVSNTESIKGAHLCFHHDDNLLGKPTINQTINCPVRGRYVIYYNERRQGVPYPGYYSQYAYNEICELEVFGCVGYFWNNCSTPCSYNCKCDLTSGICDGCSSGYWGLFCQTVCGSGFYGENCMHQCSRNCNEGNECDRFTGQCIGGCQPGWTGTMCDQGCDSGYYGKNCSNQCGINCDTITSCDKVTGICNGGCHPGWKGITCDKECESGYYGKECRHLCSANCNVTTQCNKVTGQCKGGCKTGWTGDTCNQMCGSGFYGEDCMHQCSPNCNLGNGCDRFTGQCIGGCKQGWTGIMCDQACSTGFYGKKCSEQCNNNCNETSKCDRFTGMCDGGCKPGWTGITCNDACAKSFYGTNCTYKCGTNCVNASCDHVTGDCNIDIQSLKDVNSSEISSLPIIGGSVAALVILIVIVGIIIMNKRSIRCSTGAKHDERYTNASEVTMAFSNVYQNLDIQVADNSNSNISAIKPTLKPRNKRTEVNKSVELKDEDIDIDEKIHEENPYGDFYVNEEPLIDIEIKRLGNVIEEKSKNENDGFKKEYATLLYGEKYPCDIGKLPENISKNRFKTTFPYDHSRVILASQRADYINANYIDGSKRKKMYIAAQGTIQDHISYTP